MASGLSPKLPLQLDKQDGYTLNKTHAEMIGQNLKMLILTAPGERMMDPEYGVGIRNFLFEMNNSITYQEIETRVNKQVRKYMPFLDIKVVTFSPDEIENGNANLLKIQIKYFIRPLQMFDAVEILLEDTI